MQAGCRRDKYTPERAGTRALQPAESLKPCRRKAGEYRVCEITVTLGDNSCQVILLHSDAHNKRGLLIVDISYWRNKK